jgi:hypothetical protein
VCVSSGKERAFGLLDFGRATSGGTIKLRKGYPLRKFGIVFNHDDGEYSVYPEDGVIRFKSIEFYQKEGIKVELSIINAADKDAAIRQAEVINQKYHYHNVEDTLGQYFL